MAENYLFDLFCFIPLKVYKYNKYNLYFTCGMPLCPVDCGGNLHFHFNSHFNDIFVPKCSMQ